MSKRVKIFWLSAIVLVASLVLIMKIFNYQRNNIVIERQPEFFGVTFSKKYAEEIGLDWRETYLQILDDLKVKHIRLPIYWDEIEKTKGTFDFSEYDYLISEGSKRQTHFIINIGWRLPRWPECHAPAWTNQENITDIQGDTLAMLQKTVERYRDNPAIIYWQVENEPFLNTFGICPKSDEAFLKKEVELVKSLDDRPVIISGPGELNLWKKEAKYGDVFGTTMYRVVWSNITGYLRYPIPSWFYRLKAYFAGIPKDKRIIAELQAEPWVPQGKIIHLSKSEADYSFNIDQFKANLRYAEKTRFKKAYLWGVEWWYWQFKHGDPEYWELARTIF
ncbi:MAG: cellulase family glycosylhydrolase [Bacillota bacterium]